MKKKIILLFSIGFISLCLISFSQNKLSQELPPIHSNTKVTISAELPPVHSSYELPPVN